MTKHLRKFFLQNLLVLIILGLLEFVIFKFSSIQQFYHILYPLVLILSFVVNVIVYHLFTRKPVPANRSMLLIVQSFAIKFFYYLAIAIIFIYTLTQKEEKISFVVILFIIYFAFTLVEVNAVTSFVKSESNNS